MSILCRQELSIVCKGRDQNRIAFFSKRKADCLKGTPRPGRYASFIHAEELSEISVELGDVWLGDFVKSKGLTTLITCRVTVAISDECLHRLNGQTACCLDRLNVDIVFFNLSNRYAICDLHCQALLLISIMLP